MTALPSTPPHPTPPGGQKQLGLHSCWSPREESAPGPPSIPPPPSPHSARSGWGQQGRQGRRRKRGHQEREGEVHKMTFQRADKENSSPSRNAGAQGHPGKPMGSRFRSDNRDYFFTPGVVAAIVNYYCGGCCYHQHHHHHVIICNLPFSLSGLLGVNQFLPTGGDIQGTKRGGGGSWTTEI